MRIIGLLFFCLMASPVLAGDFDREFGRPLPGMTADQLAIFERGRAIFNRDWVPYPGYRDDLDGLGPLFNRASCSGCHFANGRGRPPLTPDAPFISMVLRLEPPHPVYGEQINDRGLPGVPAEGQPKVSYFTLNGDYEEGEGYSLLVPEYRVDALAYGPLSGGGLSPRVAPHIAGVGLLEEIAEADILAHEDPDDRDGNGISGLARWVGAGDGKLIGRFGWKAQEPTLRSQTVSALHQDIGITSADRPIQNCTSAQSQCRNAASGMNAEISDADLRDLIRYQQSLAPPAAAPPNKEGLALFKRLECSACHVTSLGNVPAYTDLLLHDMGPGLADDGDGAFAREWRTPPLWGIGKLEVVNGHTRLLHDGRARNVEEAILWHGGEAEAAKRAFKELTAASRKILIDFVEGL